MQVGMIGLGRMGSNMARRLLRGGHDCVVIDVSPKAVEAFGREKGGKNYGSYGFREKAGEATDTLVNGSGGSRGQNHL